MFHIKERANSQIEVKKSKFYGILIPVSDDHQIKEIINGLKKEYPSATHYCYGAIIGDISRSNDDGEPSSTAGKPILEVLKNSELDNVLAVVVRYFGGTLLGTAGLVKAYSEATKLAVENASFTTPTKVYNYSITVSYDFTNKLEYLLKNKATITNRQYGEQATYFYQCLQDISDDLNQLTSGKFTPVFISEEIVEK